MLEAPADPPATRAAEGTARARHESEGHAQAAAPGIRDREDRLADRHRRLVGRPVEWFGPGRVRLENGQVAVRVDTDDLRRDGAAVVECDRHLVAADVVSVGEDAPGREDDAGAMAPAVDHADHARTDLIADSRDGCLELFEDCHWIACLRFVFCAG